MKSNFNKQIKIPSHSGVDHRATGFPVSSTWGESSSMVFLRVRIPKIPLDQPAYCYTGLGAASTPHPSPSISSFHLFPKQTRLTDHSLTFPCLSQLPPLPLRLLQSCLKLHLGYPVDLGSTAQWLSGSPVQSEGAWHTGSSWFPMWEGEKLFVSQSWRKSYLHNQVRPVQQKLFRATPPTTQ